MQKSLSAYRPCWDFIRFVLVVSVFTLLASPSWARKHSSLPKQSTLRRRHAQVNREKQQVRNRLHQVKKQERVARSRLVETQQHLERSQEQLRGATARWLSARHTLAEANEKLHQAEDRLHRHQLLMGERMVALRQRGRARMMEVMLASTSFPEFANRLYLAETMVKHDLDLLEQIADDRRQVAAYRMRVAAEEIKVNRYRQAVAVRTSEVQEQRNSQAQQVQDLRQKRAACERELAALEQSSREIAAMLRRYYRSRSGRASLNLRWNGRFLRPVPGGIISGYGMRFHPILKERRMHTGVDMRAGAGTSIRAAAAGQVVHSGWWGGYGKCVIIDHGSGTSTLYGHCSSLAVSAGSKVKARQVIGSVGSTGLSTGPHLHFEVRKNGVPVNPL